MTEPIVETLSELCVKLARKSILKS